MKVLTHPVKVLPEKNFYKICILSEFENKIFIRIKFSVLVNFFAELKQAVTRRKKYPRGSPHAVGLLHQLLYFLLPSA